MDPSIFEIKLPNTDIEGSSRRYVMHYFEFGKRDATIYSGGTTASINTGFDEILEINKVVMNNGTIGNVSRVLIDFDYAYISESIQNGRIPSLQNFI